MRHTLAGALSALSLVSIAAAQIEDLSGPPFRDTTPVAISADGSTVLVRWADGNDNTQTHRWTAESGIEILDSGALFASVGVALSADGRYAAGATNNGFTTTRAIRWNPDGSLSTLAISGSPVAVDISGDGQTVIGHRFGVGFVWTAATGPVDIDVPPGGGAQRMIAISQDGSAVVLFDGISRRTYRWTHATGTVDISPSAATDVFPTSIS
ncbi:MAG: hypothetical protein AAGG01_20540, partial [Planctomycetota bacterium]